MLKLLSMYVTDHQRSLGLFATTKQHNTKHTPVLKNIPPADACIHNKLVSAFAIHNLLGPVPGAVKVLAWKALTVHFS